MSKFSSNNICSERNFILGLSGLYTKKMLNELEKSCDLDKVRRNVMDEVISYVINCGKRSYFETNLKNSSRVMDDIVSSLEEMELCYVDLSMRVSTRLLVGASSGLFSSILEVGLSWDPILDLPYIPASSLRGVLRSFLILQCSELAEEHDRRVCLEKVIELFGSNKGKVFHKVEREVEKSFGGIPESEESSGMLMFFDSYPIDVEDAVLSLDVMTPHYYKKGEPVLNELEVEPVPIQYVTVPRNVIFRVVVAVRGEGRGSLKDLGNKLGIGVDFMGVLTKMLLLALGVWGVGGKTGKGYGILEYGDVKALRVSCSSSQRKSSRIKWR